MQEFKERCIVHQRKAVFEKPLVQYLEKLFNESTVSIQRLLQCEYIKADMPESNDLYKF